jgi:hypothetical protein
METGIELCDVGTVLTKEWIEAFIKLALLRSTSSTCALTKIVQGVFIIRHIKIITSLLLKAILWNFISRSTQLWNVFIVIGKAELSNKMASYTVDWTKFVCQNLLPFWCSDWNVFVHVEPSRDTIYQIVKQCEETGIVCHKRAKERKRSASVSYGWNCRSMTKAVTRS